MGERLIGGMVVIPALIVFAVAYDGFKDWISDPKMNDIQTKTITLATTSALKVPASNVSQPRIIDAPTAKGINLNAGNTDNNDDKSKEPLCRQNVDCFVNSF